MDDANDPTLAATPAQTIGDEDDDVAAGRASLPGYKQGRLLGRGGMGEVVLAHDERIGRKVAVKRMRAAAPSDEALARFMREARIQARLEHPAIVPVYELGKDTTGAPYFTMKRLDGVTLGKLVEAEARDQKALLRAIVDVCLAIEFAHTHGVVHRDLKPTNIMLGNFGEVYVLDWGVARVTADDDGALADVTTLESAAGQTQEGDVLGTPGYMAPEQLHGEPVGPACDVYAIGSILFELLAGEPLHPRGAGAIASTLVSATASPAARRPDLAIAPELDAACREAIAPLPADRPTARAPADRIQRYLDGDRDGERRRALAADSLATARAAADSGDPTRRAEAMAAAGRALALDPESRDAAALVSKLMLEPPPPDAMPAELVAKIREDEVDQQVRAARSTVYAMAAFSMFVPFAFVVEITSWATVVAMFGTIAALTGLAQLNVTTRRSMAVPFTIGFAILMVLFTRLFGPFVVVPGLLGVASAVLVGIPDFIDRPWVPIGIAVGALLAPLALEESHVLGSTWSPAGAHLTTTSTAIALEGAAATTLLVFGNVMLIVVNAIATYAIARMRRQVDRRLTSQAWHLSKLLPS